jgi:predicted permease
VLLVSTGLLVRSLMHVLDVDLGFQPANAVAVPLNLAEIYSTANGDPSRVAVVIERLSEQVQAIPGVQAVGLSDALPLGRSRTWGLRVIGQVSGRDTTGANVYAVDPGYLGAMRIALLAGRDFTRADMSPGRGSAAGSTPIIVNDRIARRLWPDRSPLGMTLRTDAPEVKGVLMVVGVAADVRQGGVDREPVPQFYIPYTRIGGGLPDLIIRSTLGDAALINALRASLPPPDQRLMFGKQPRSLNHLVDDALTPRRLVVRLVGGFALLALLLAALGIYGVVMYTVSRRTHEFGLRMALGATPRDLGLNVLATTGRVAIGGVVAGLLGAVAASQLLVTSLYDTSPFDPLVYAITALVLLAVALAAAYVPARRAARTSPLVAMRAD